MRTLSRILTTCLILAATACVQADPFWLGADISGSAGQEARGVDLVDGGLHVVESVREVRLPNGVLPEPLPPSVDVYDAEPAALGEVDPVVHRGEREVGE